MRPDVVTRLTFDLPERSFSYILDDSVLPELRRWVGCKFLVHSAPSLGSTRIEMVVWGINRVVLCLVPLLFLAYISRSKISHLKDQ